MLSRLSSFSGPISKVFKIILSNTIDDFNYLNFSSTDGLSLVSTNGISNNWIYITNTNTGEVGNVYISDNFWDGRLGVVAIYKTALTSSEILQNHNSIKNRYGL